MRWFEGTGNTIFFCRHIGWFLYFSIIIAGISKSGMWHILFVFSRALRIHLSPFASSIICSDFKCCISVNARPLRQQNTKISLTISNRGISNFFSIIECNSFSVRKSRLLWVCLNLIPEKGLSVIHLLVNARVVIFFNIFKYLTVAFCAQPFSVLTKYSNFSTNWWLIFSKGVCQNWHTFFYAQGPDFHKLGLCYYLKIMYL